MRPHTVLVLGGYGFFGARIAAGLCGVPGLRVLIGGRDAARALEQARALGVPADQALRIDATAPDLAGALAAACVDTLIHTAGPFQGQDYAVPRAAIAAGCHYLDLADARAYVAGIGALDAEAREAGVCVIAGASSVPALSSAVIECYRGDFARLESIAIGIASGGRAPGEATMRAVFGYCGLPMRRWQGGAWTRPHGWLDPVRHRFPAPVGARWLGACDVPDLELFPRRYAPVRSVSFHAGVAGPGHFVVALGALLVRAGLLRSLEPWAAPLHRASRAFERWASPHSAMFVRLEGVDAQGRPLQRTWHLLAGSHHGPYVPCGASIALARRLAAGNGPASGAQPCVGLLGVEEYLAALPDLELSVIER